MFLLFNFDSGDFYHFVTTWRFVSFHDGGERNKMYAWSRHFYRCEPPQLNVEYFSDLTTKGKAPRIMFVFNRNYMHVFLYVKEYRPETIGNWMKNIKETVFINLIDSQYFL